MKICTLLIISLLVCLGATQTTDVCPDGLSRDRFLQVHGNSCFRFVAKPKKDYNDAEADCERDGGTLVMVKNKDVENYLLDQLSQYKVYTTVWIGAQDKVSESHWEWEDGTPVEYTNWAFDEGPGHIWGNSEEQEDCIGMDFHGYWHDYKCEGGDSFFSFINDNTFPYVCQYPIKSGLETPKTTGAPTQRSTTEAPTQRPTTVAPTQRPTTVAPTQRPTTVAPTQRPTTVAPTQRPTTVAPTQRPTTVAPTQRPTTLAPSQRSTTVAPTQRPTTVAPTQRPTTLAPTQRPTTVAPTQRPTTVAPTQRPATGAPTQRPTTEAITPKPMEA